MRYFISHSKPNSEVYGSYKETEALQVPVCLTLLKGKGKVRAKFRAWLVVTTGNSTPP